MAGQTILDQIEHLLELEAALTRELDRRGLGLTPHAALVVGWLGRHRAGTARHISLALGLGESTVRKIVGRLVAAGLARYVDGPPRPGRPVDDGPQRGNVELTAAGLRVYDRLRQPARRENPEA